MVSSSKSTTASPSSDSAPARRRGLNSKYPEVNALYGRARAFWDEHLKTRLLVVEALEEEGVQGEAMTWCGLHRFEAFPGKPWRFYTRNLETMAWERFDYATDALHQPSFPFPSMLLLPIAVRNKVESKDFATLFVAGSLGSLWQQVGHPFYGSCHETQPALKPKELEEMVVRHLGYERPDKYAHQAQGKVWTEELDQRVDTFLEEETHLGSSLEMGRRALATQLAGRKRKGPDASGLSPVEMAQRGFFRQFWKMMDKTSLNVFATMHWREPVGLQQWVKFNLHFDNIMEIASQARGLLPVLPKIPAMYWKWEILSDPVKLADLVFPQRKKGIAQDSNIYDVSKTEPLEETSSSNPVARHSVRLQQLKRERELSNTMSDEDAKAFGLQLLSNSVSNNHYLLYQKVSYDSKLDAQRMVWTLQMQKTWETHGLPKWVRARLTSLAKNFYPGEGAVLPYQTETWHQEWCESVNMMIEHFKKQDGFHAVQRNHHPLWQGILNSFLHQDTGWGRDKWQDNGGFFDSMPNTHPWHPILSKARLEKVVDQASREAVPMVKKRL